MLKRVKQTDRSSLTLSELFQTSDVQCREECTNPLPEKPPQFQRAVRDLELREVAHRGFTLTMLKINVIIKSVTSRCHSF